MNEYREYDQREPSAAETTEAFVAGSFSTESAGCEPYRCSESPQVLARMPDLEPGCEPGSRSPRRHSRKTEDGRWLSQALSAKILVGAAAALLLAAVLIPFISGGKEDSTASGDLPSWAPEALAPNADVAPSWGTVGPTGTKAEAVSPSAIAADPPRFHGEAPVASPTWNQMPQGGGASHGGVEAISTPPSHGAWPQQEPGQSLTTTPPEAGPRRIMPPQRNSRPVVEPQSYRENRYTSPSPTYDARYQRPQAGANHPMAIEAPEGATRRDIQNGGYPAQRLASRPEVGAETPRYSVAPAEAGAGQYQTNSTDLHGAGRYQTSSSGGEYSPYGSAPRQGDSYPPNSDPTNRYQDSTASGYPEAAQRRYQSTPASGSYPSVPSSPYPPPPSSNPGYGTGTGHGTGSQTTPENRYPTTAPANQGTGVVPQYPSTQPASEAEPGVAQFQGVIEKPTIRTSYDRARPSFH